MPLTVEQKGMCMAAIDLLVRALAFDDAQSLKVGAEMAKQAWAAGR